MSQDQPLSRPARVVPQLALVGALPPRISKFGSDVVTDIAARLGVDHRVVMRAMLTVALHHQKELENTIKRLTDAGPDF